MLFNNLEIDMKKGDRKTILNTTPSGVPIIEGEATLVKEFRNLFSEYPAWFVLFDGEGEVPVRRTIYPKSEIAKIIIG